MVATWTNSDGLRIVYGTDEATAGKAGAQNLLGTYHVLEAKIVFGDIASTGTILDHNLVIPKNARIDKVEVITTTAWDSAGDAFVLNVGTIQKSSTTGAETELDYDGLVAALPQASMDPAGDWATVDVNHTYKGAQIGTTLSVNGYLCFDYDTAAPTAGAAIVRVFYRFL